MESEKKHRRNLLYSFLYLLCLYIGIKLLPLKDWIPVAWGSELAFTLLFLFLLILIFVEIKRAKPFTVKKKLPWYSSLPFLLVCCSNLIYGFFYLKVNEAPDFSLFALRILQLALCCTIEEMLFRVFLLQFFLETIKEHTEILSILFSSIAFSLMHTINFFSNPVGAVFMQLGYTFFIGLTFGIFSLYSHRYWLPALMHIAFNFFNSLLPTTLFSFTYDWIYVVLSIGLGAAFALYICVLLFILYKKKETDFTENK